MSTRLSLGLMAWVFAIAFLFVIPHTIALRNLLLLLGLVVVFATWRHPLRPSLPPMFKPVAWALIALTGWIVLQAIAVSPAPTIALGNLRGDWVMPFLTGTLAAWITVRIDSPRPIQTAISALLLHMLLVAFWQAGQWWQTGAWPFGSMPFAERDYHSTLSNFLVALLLADRLAYIFNGQSPVYLGRWPGWLLTIAAIGTDVLIRARNGTLTILVLLLGVVIALLIERRTRRQALLLAVIITVVAGAIGAASWRNDTRWPGLVESLQVGWTSPSLYWLTNDGTTRPATPSGAVLEESAYARAAWARQAVDAIKEHPLGLGFGRDGFGRAVAEKHGVTGMISSHSGWLDFALGVGLPGLALLLLATALAIRGGWRQFRQHDDGVGLMLSFLVGGYLLRCLLDGHFSGWRLGLFAFICGVLIASMNGSVRHKP